MTSTLIALPLAGLIGLSLGLLGGGGSILTVPILVYVLGFDPKQSIAMGLAIVGVTSLFGALSHWRKGNVQLRPATVFAAVSMVGTYLGARVSALVPGAAQLILFGAVMLVSAFFMFRNARRDAARATSSGKDGEAPLAPKKSSFVVVAVAGLGVGGLTGIAGVGGGFLIVPALVLMAGLPMTKAVGTSLLLISLNSFVGFAGYLGHVDVPWAYLSLFTAVAVVGILAGTWASRHVSQATLKSAFSVFLVVMGVFILYKNRESFVPNATAHAAPARPSSPSR